MKPIYSISLVALTLVACNNAANSGMNSTTETETETTHEEVAVVDNHATSGAVDAYLELKDALVMSDVDESAKAADALMKELSALEESDTLLTVIKLASDSLRLSQDLNLQRSAFEIISDNFYIYLKEAGNGRPLYRQYCPMAFNNQGAYWLSDEEAVMNPYFGDQMLKCGRVDEKL